MMFIWSQKNSPSGCVFYSCWHFMGCQRNSIERLFFSSACVLWYIGWDTSIWKDSIGHCVIENRSFRVTEPSESICTHPAASSGQRPPSSEPVWAAGLIPLSAPHWLVSASPEPRRSPQTHRPQSFSPGKNELLCKDLRQALVGHIYILILKACRHETGGDENNQYLPRERNKVQLNTEVYSN